jgi:hypothetical protein
MKRSFLITLTVASLLLSACSWGPFKKDIADEVYSMGIEGVNKEFFLTSIVHPREELSEKESKQQPMNIGGDDNNLYTFDHPFLGLACGQLEYQSAYDPEKQIVYFQETQQKNCEEKRSFFVTTLLNDTRPIKEIVLEQKLGEETINTYHYLVSEADTAGLTATPEGTPIDLGAESQS